MNTDGIQTAFDLLLREIEEGIQTANREGAQALQAGDYDRATAVINHAKRLKELYAQVQTLQQAWSTSSVVKPAVSGKSHKFVRESSRHRLKGSRTQEEAFRIPILEALVESGGRATVGDVLHRVEQQMKGTLTPVDYERLPKSGEIRWRNTAQWCRKKLVKEGLLKEGSPRGIWEISEKGIRWLKAHR